MRRVFKSSIAFVPVVALSLSACTDAIGPDALEPLDAVSANQQAQSVTQSLESNPALPSLEILETTTPFLAGTAAGVLLQSAAPFNPGANGEGLAARLERVRTAAAPYLSSAEPAVILPADLLGKTMVYNAATEQYEPEDPDRGGAPANGVRFILYALDPVFKRPIVEQEVGYADFMDESTPAEDAMRIVVVMNSAPDSPVIDYRASASVEVLGGVTIVFRALGFVDDGNRRLEFDLEQRISENERLELNYELESVDSGITITFTALAGPEVDGVQLMLSVKNEREEIKLTLTVTEAGITGQLVLPGSDNPINIQANRDEWSITHEDGSEVTEDEKQAIRNMFQLMERIEHVVRKLMRPAHRILGVPLFALD